jgi:hypothetical protein
VSAKDDKDDEDKKPSVIHTRVPEALDQEIKKRASGLGVSVSNLVRNVLLNTFGLVEHVLADSANVALSATVGAAPKQSSRVVAWQDVTMNVNAVCDRCNSILAKGTRAAIAIATPPAASPTFRCTPCIKELADE